MESSEVVESVIDIEPVWSAHPVGFSLLTHGRRQYVAYYDANRQMTVAQRKLDSNEWVFTRLPSRIGWDSHNYVTMAIDADGHLHVSGNMHVAPLAYFRTTQPGDASTLVRVPNMVGPEREQRVTYPHFLRGPKGETVFKYRDGRSGQGDEIYNVYDPKTRQWRRLLDEPLTSGQGRMNAYFSGPVLGPDGWYHLAWVWRDTPDAATNHDLSYARSKDLIRWETSAGKELKPPITLETGDIVDAVAVRKGLINTCIAVGFDGRKRPIVTYHKYDPAGNSQIYCARLEEGRWVIRQTSDWKDYCWKFGGGGSLVGEVGHGRVSASPDGQLTLDYRCKLGSGTWILDANTMKAVGSAPARKNPLGTLAKVESDFPEMQKKTAGDLGRCDEPGVRYMLVWETLGANRDRPREGPLPKPSMLRAVRLGKLAATTGPAGGTAASGPTSAQTATQQARRTADKRTDRSASGSSQAFAQPAGEPGGRPRMMWADSSRSGRPFSKDPCVIRLGGRYLMYYSMGPSSDKKAPPGWAVGIAESNDLVNWRKAGEILPEQECERNGLVNGRTIVLDGKVHLFYNTYGNGRNDSICHATSDDGLRFTRDPGNPILRASGDWNSGRAIDLDVFEHEGKLMMLFATRDPTMKIQMLVAAGADRKSDFGRGAWKQLCDGPVLKPELPWETKCIEAPSVVKRGDTLYLFYGGGYNNDPQQIGCATSRDGIVWKRLFEQPLLPNGKPGEWNSSESGHPGIFIDGDGRTYMFLQGNNDRGHTWYISCVEIGWRDGKPFVMGEPTTRPQRR